VSSTASVDARLSRWFAGVFGAVLGLALLKFGNPIILDRLIDPPSNALEYLFQPWPVRYGYLLLGVCVLVALPLMRLPFPAPRWVLILPLCWLGWQFLSAAQTVDTRLTQPTVIHFVACVLCFFLGLMALGRLADPGAFWMALLGFFGFVLWNGFEQHYGGLQATRELFYQQPNWQQASPEYLKKIQSDRIFATLVYPNALAAAILLLLPPGLVTAWRLTSRLADVSRLVIVAALAYGGLACLYWSGSKSGWLIALLLALITLLTQVRLSRSARLAIVAAVLAGGLAAFFIRYAGYFQRGAPSVSARMDYWRAAGQTALAHPILGTGPGTFSVAYRQIKRPESEMAQLTHNDYLEQASDSGFPGALAYAAFVVGSVGALPRCRRIFAEPRWYSVWLGVLGWAVQSTVEFLLYIPALTWTAFALLGWLWSRPAGAPQAGNNQIDTAVKRG
jgi:O-antigen ligase